MLISIYHVPGTVPKALHVLSWNSHNNQYYCYWLSVLLFDVSTIVKQSHFTDEETKARRGRVPSPRSHN